MARCLEDMPVARDAMARGDLSTSGARVLATAREADPEAFRRSEEHLVEAARVHSVGDLARVAAYWRQAIEREHALDGDEELRAQRRLHASRSLPGTVRVDGTLDPESGETLLTALRAVTDTEARSGTDDDRTPGQRRADALTEVCRRWLDGALSGQDTVAFAWISLLAFVRLATKEGLFPSPLTLDAAMDRVDAWLAAAPAVVVEPTVWHARGVRDLLRGLGVGGNLVNDAHLAALAIEHGATLVTTDRDFARFDKLDWQDPLASAPQ